jgi:hypothetical protein
MSTILVAFLLSIAQAPVGPEDAFRANYAAIQAEVQYAFRAGLAPADVLARLRTWSTDGISFIEDPGRTLEVKWACDGVSQRLAILPAISPGSPAVGNSPGDALKQSSGLSRGPGAPITRGSAAGKGFEVLWDDEVRLEHHFDRPDVQVHLGNQLGVLYTHAGPFLWWGIFEYPVSLKTNFGKAAPVVHRATIGGRDLVIAVYHDDYEPDGWARLEVYHDPSLGYLPRAARYIFVAGQGAGCRELFLTGARPCSAGGFVPTEVYQATFEIAVPKRIDKSEFDDRLPRPSPRGQINMRFLAATSFRNAIGPVGLEWPGPGKTIVGQGGAVPWNSGAALSINRMRTMLGRKLTDPPKGRLPAIDVAELSEYAEKPRTGWTWYGLGIASIGFACAVCFWRWRRASALLLITLAGSFWQVGCAPTGIPEIKLSGDFEPAVILYESKQATIPLILNVRNAGNSALQVLNVDGGCACRRVDQSGFPAIIKAGANCKVPVNMTVSSASGVGQYLFGAQTSSGGLSFPVSLTLFPRNRVSPETIGIPNLVEEQGWEFELIHRAIFESRLGPLRHDLVVPAEFVATRLKTQRGKVNAAPQFEYQDTSYRVALNDRKVGLHKSILGLINEDGGRELDVPVVWRRVEYLSAMPDRAFMGPRTLRVFLRCPDERVELTQVLSTPKGVRAIVSSPLEVNVMLTDDAPPIIDGVIIVGTTAKDRPPLRIPATRYSVATNK